MAVQLCMDDCRMYLLASLVELCNSASPDLPCRALQAVDSCHRPGIEPETFDAKLQPFVSEL